MAKSRTSLVLVLAFLFSAGAVAGAPCAPVAADGGCAMAPVEDGAGGAALAAVEPEATFETSSRSMVPVLPVVAVGARHDGPSDRSAPVRRDDAIGGSTPLYLSHCVFLR